MSVAADRSTLLRLEDVHVHIGQSHILQGVSFDVPDGGVTALLGRNGVGKTTTLRAIMGLLGWRGRIDLDGYDLARMEQERVRRNRLWSLVGWPVALAARAASRGSQTHRIVQRGVGYVPEDREIFAGLTVAENLRLAERDGNPRYDLVYELFPRLRERTKQRAGTMSGGEQQMLAIARALLNENRILLIDEPTKGLAPNLVTEVARGLERASQHETILLVEQNLGVVQSLARDAIVLDQGRVVYRGPAEELLADRAKVQRLLGVSKAQEAA